MDILKRLNQLSIVQDNNGDFLLLRDRKVLKRAKDENTVYDYMRTEIKRIKGEDGKKTTV